MRYFCLILAFFIFPKMAAAQVSVDSAKRKSAITAGKVAASDARTSCLQFAVSQKNIQNKMAGTPAAENKIDPNLSDYSKKKCRKEGIAAGEQAYLNHLISNPSLSAEIKELVFRKTHSFYLKSSENAKGEPNSNNVQNSRVVMLQCVVEDNRPNNTIAMVYYPKDTFKDPMNGDTSTVSIDHRLDGATLTSTQWKISDRRKAYKSQSADSAPQQNSAVDWIIDLLEHKKLSLETPSQSGRKIVSNFNLADMDTAVSHIASRCGWGHKLTP